MTQLTTSAPVSERPLSGASVRQFLASNPGFLDQNPDLLAAHLGATIDERTDGAIDFQQRLLARLRNQTETLMAQRRELLAITAENQAVQQRIHAAALHLMDAPTLSRLLTAVTSDLALLLEVDLVALLIEASASQPLPVAEQIHIVPSGTLDLVFNGHDGLRTRAELAGDPVVFGERAALVRSHLLIRLSIGRPRRLQGLLAFGSHQPGAFGPELATDAVEFLAGIAQRCLARFICP